MIIVLIMLLVFLYILNELTKKNTLKKLSYRREFSSNRVEIGEEFKIETILENHSVLPISFLQVIEQIPKEVRYKYRQEEFERNNERTHEMSLFLLPKQRVIRRYAATFDQRGRHFFRNVALCGGDFFGFTTEDRLELMDHDVIVYPNSLDLEAELVSYGSEYGDISVRRWIISDPILTAGLREYTGNEPQKHIHWPSSIRQNRLMVKNFDFTTDNRVMILLNVESNRPYSALRADEIEKCLSVTRAVMEELENKGVPYGFASNIYYHDSSDGKGYIPAGQGADHFFGILDLLAITNFHSWKTVEELLECFRSGQDRYETFIIITPIVLTEYIEGLNLLAKHAGKTTIITMMDDNIQELSDGIGIFLGKEQG